MFPNVVLELADQIDVIGDFGVIDDRLVSQMLQCLVRKQEVLGNVTKFLIPQENSP